MSIPRYHLDSNVLLRFFTGEPAAMFDTGEPVTPADRALLAERLAACEQEPNAGRLA